MTTFLMFLRAYGIFLNKIFEHKNETGEFEIQPMAGSLPVSGAVLFAKADPDPV